MWLKKSVRPRCGYFTARTTTLCRLRSHAKWPRRSRPPAATSVIVHIRGWGITPGLAPTPRRNFSPGCFLKAPKCQPRADMSLYSKHIFPRLLELTLGNSMIARQRREALASAHGHVLEIGFGTGLNLPH